MLNCHRCGTEFGVEGPPNETEECALRMHLAECSPLIVAGKKPTPQHTLLSLFAKGLAAGAEPCPGCNQVITFSSPDGGTSVDMLHPKPGCEAFKAFLQRLFATQSQMVAR